MQFLSTKPKIVDIKKEKPKPENIMNSPPKEDIDLEKCGLELKSDNQCECDILYRHQMYLIQISLYLGGKKQVKKEHKKVLGNVVSTLGPALFSTPDIIRRVGSGGDLKMMDNSTLISGASNNSALGNASLLNTNQIVSPTSSCVENKSPITTESDRMDQETESSSENLSVKEDTSTEQKGEVISEDLQPSLEPGNLIICYPSYLIEPGIISPLNLKQE